MKSSRETEGGQKPPGGKHPWLNGQAPEITIGRAEMRSLLSDLKVLFETIEIGDADALREVQEKGEEGLRVVDELQELLMATHEKLSALREMIDHIAVSADQGEEGGGAGKT